MYFVSARAVCFLRASALAAPEVPPRFSVAEAFRPPYRTCCCALRQRESARRVPAASEGGWDRLGFAWAAFCAKDKSRDCFCRAEGRRLAGD